MGSHSSDWFRSMPGPPGGSRSEPSVLRSLIKPVVLSIIVYLLADSCVCPDEGEARKSSLAPGMRGAAALLIGEHFGSNEINQDTSSAGDVWESYALGDDSPRVLVKRRSEIQDLGQVSSLAELNTPRIDVGYLVGSPGSGLASSRNEQEDDEDEDDLDDDDRRQELAGGGPADQRNSIIPGLKQMRRAKNKTRATGAKVAHKNQASDDPRLFKLGLILGR